jgi:hypothetical protein
MRALGASLRHRIDHAYEGFCEAFDRAANSADPDRVDDLRDATDALMRALAQVILQTSREEPD